MLNKEIINMMHHILPRGRNKDFVECSNAIIEGKYMSLPPYKLDISDGIDWSDSKSSRSLLRLFHGHTFLGDLDQAYEKTKEEKYINMAIELIIDYIQFIKNIELNNKIVYHDETTALRFTYWLRYYIDYFDFFDDYNKIIFRESIRETAEILSADDFHAGLNNHGMFQDFALFNYSLIFEDEDIKSKEYRRIATLRLRKYFDFVFTTEYVHKEHTPTYHYLICSILRKYGQALQNIDCILSSYFLNIYNKSIEFGIHIIQPDGFLPQIGDCPKVNMKASSYKDLYDSDEFKYAVSAGENGFSPKKNNIVFKKSGYAIFRNKWDKRENSTYILFSAAYHTDYHKHSDDLSLVIYHKGDFLIDSGPNGYNYSDEFTKYGYSSFAHNTLIVNDKGLPRTDKKYDKVYINDYSTDEKNLYVSGINDRFDEVKHLRFINYCNKENTITITDSLESKNYKLNNYKLLFHFAEGIILYKKSNNEIYAIKNKRIVAKIILESNIEKSTNIYEGMNEGIKSVVFYEFEMYKNTQMIEISINSKDDLNIVTKFNLYDSEKYLFEDILYEINDIKINKIEINKVNQNQLIVDIDVKGSNCELAYYLYRNKDVIEKVFYSDNKYCVFDIDEKGIYFVRVFVRDKCNLENRVVENSDKLYFK